MMRHGSQRNEFRISLRLEPVGRSPFVRSAIAFGSFVVLFGFSLATAPCASATGTGFGFGEDTGNHYSLSPGLNANYFQTNVSKEKTGSAGAGVFLRFSAEKRGLAVGLETSYETVGKIGTISRNIATLGLDISSYSSGIDAFYRFGFNYVNVLNYRETEGAGIHLGIQKDFSDIIQLSLEARILVLNTALGGPYKSHGAQLVAGVGFPIWFGPEPQDRNEPLVKGQRKRRSGPPVRPTYGAPAPTPVAPTTPDTATPAPTDAAPSAAGEPTGLDLSEPNKAAPADAAPDVEPSSDPAPAATAAPAADTLPLDGAAAEATGVAPTPAPAASGVDTSEP